MCIVHRIVCCCCHRIEVVTLSSSSSIVVLLHWSYDVIYNDDVGVCLILTLPVGERYIITINWLCHWTTMTMTTTTAMKSSTRCCCCCNYYSLHPACTTTTTTTMAARVGSVGRKHHTHTTEQDRTIAKVGEVRGARAELLLYLVLNERRKRRQC